MPDKIVFPFTGTATIQDERVSFNNGQRGTKCLPEKF